MDIKMTGMNGLQCTKILREKLNFKGKIIALTSHIDSECLSDYLESGMDDVVAKPVTMTELRNISRKHGAMNNSRGNILPA